MLSNKLNINYKDFYLGYGNPVKKDELLELSEMKKSLCQISFMRLMYGGLNVGKETGFFCEIDKGPIKHALFITHHFLDEFYIAIGVILDIYILKDLHILKSK